MSSNPRGALYALIAFGVFASHDVVVKFLGGVYSPIQTIFFSVLLSFPLVAVMLMRDETSDTLRPRHPWWTALRTLATVITGFSAYYAFSVLPLAQVYAILFAAPLIITILSIPVLGEVVKMRRWMAVIVGLIGVMVVLRPGSTQLEWGHLAALAAAIGGALASIIVRKIGKDERNVVLIIYPMVANFVVMAILLPFVYQPMPILDFGALALLAVLAHVATRFMILAYKTGEAATVAPMQYSQIIWAAFYGFFFFNETPDMATAIGAAIIILSGLYILFREHQPGHSENRPVTRTRSRAETGTHPRVSAVIEAEAKND